MLDLYQDDNKIVLVVVNRGEIIIRVVNSGLSFQGSSHYVPFSCLLVRDDSARRFVSVGRALHIHVRSSTIVPDIAVAHSD